MRTKPPPGYKLVKHWIGKRVITKVEMQNGYATVPIGSKGTVVDALSGLAIKFDACPHCGIQLRMTKISPYNVIPIDNCSRCRGVRGGVPGNENVVNGVVLCDYCSADDLQPARKSLQHPDAGPRGERYPFGDPQ